MRNRAVWLSFLVWIVCLHGVSGQTIECPTRLAVSAPGILIFDNFDPDEIKVSVANSEIRCTYSLSARLSRIEPDASDCTSQGYVKASLMGSAALNAKLPEGFSHWKFNPRETQLVFEKYSQGRCRYGPKAYSEVSLFSVIPAGTSCEVLASSDAEVTCNERHLLCDPGRVTVSSFGVQLCGKCPVGEVSDGKQSECRICPAGSAPNASHSACEVCGAGQIAKGDHCSLCDRGTIPNANHAACVACDKDKIVSGGSCVSCSPGTQPNSERNACIVCGGNQVVKGTQCVACANGSIPNGEHTACNACEEGQISEGGRCSSCLPGTVPNAEQSACRACTGDQISQGGACVSCAIGTLPTSDHSYCYVVPKQSEN